MATRTVSPTRLTKGRSHWVKQVLAATTPENEKTGAVDPPKKKRFVEPYRFDAQQRQSLLAAMEKASVGDQESRTLFLAALEYNVATYKQMAPNAPPLPAPTPSAAQPPRELERLAAAAEVLTQHLADLSPEVKDHLLNNLQADDRFRRGYDNNYLSALKLEIDRLSHACGPTEPQPPAQSGPTLTPAGKRFIALVANAFTECFEIPLAAGNGTFASVLAAVIDTVTLPLPTDTACIDRALTER